MGKCATAEPIFATGETAG